MALPPNRILLRGDTPYPWEREALDFIFKELPSSSPCLAWELVELQDPSTGRQYEIDLLILGHSALYLVEIKSGPGLYRGDSVDWHREHNGRPYLMDCPYPLANRKAKVLAGMLGRKMSQRAPFVQAMIFLSHEDVKLDLRADGLTGVVTRKNVIRGITHGELPNLERGRRDAVPSPAVRDLQKALFDIGVRAKKTTLTAGAYELAGLIDEGPGYQDREAKHRTTKGIQARARTYLVPQQTSIERRQSLLRAASREAQLLHELREHPGILRFIGIEDDAGPGPTVLFDAFEGSTRLDQLVRKETKMPFLERIDLIAQIGRALAYCHRKSVLHGALNPEAVLVRRRDDGSLETRLFNFQLGSQSDRVEPTAHVSTLNAQPWLVYQAPEVRLDPTARTPQSDVFSLGALAYFVLTGQAPALDASALDARLAKSGALDPRVVDDTIPAGVADVIASATDASWANRFDNPNDWVEYLLSYATAPTDTAKVDSVALVDPLTAQKSDLVAPDLEVKAVLGQGATARVLHVERQSDGADFALKVSLDAEHDERLRAESRELGELRHPRIVQRIEDRVVGGRAAILMTLAGTRTLQRELSDKGPVSLELALRWGEDLLEAIEYLETIDKLHRDIKPANLGVGTTNKKASRLTLFDFSLVLVGDDDRHVGTAAYRDPFLGARERWDAAADRWSAAITLHEMLTGARPKGPTPAEPNAPLVLAAERFDASIRDRLVAFFEKALARDVDKRFATAEAMRRAYAAGFTTSVHSTTGDEEEALPALTPEILAAVRPDTLIEALPLTVRAKNALDRAGVLRANDLLRLPDNRISLIRGLGTRTAKEIQDFRAKWSESAKLTPAATKAFFPDYRGEDGLLIAEGALTESIATALSDAGLRTLGVVAAAPQEQVTAIAARAGFDVAIVRDHLHAESRRAEERDRPTTLEGWCEALLPAKKAAKLVRVLFGLGTPVLPIGATAEDVHRAEGSSSAAVYVALSKARKEWSAHPAVGELVVMVRAIVEEAGNTITLEDAARKLLDLVSFDRARAADDTLRSAAALVRIASEVERDAEVPRVVVVRVGRAGLWACTSSQVVAVLRALGAAADALAMRSPLASATEAQAELSGIAAGTKLELAPDRLVALAAAASEKAACSTRLEIYPRAMPAERALDLTAAVLATKAGEGISIADLRARIAERYPEAEPLPDQPKLDGLLAVLGLVWSEGESLYRRPNEPAATTHGTSFSDLRHQRTALPNEPLAQTETAIEAREFDEKLLRAVEQRELRVVFVPANLMTLATRKIAQRIGRPITRLDRLLLERMEKHRQKLQVPDDAYFKADREGAAGKTWGVLMDAVVAPAVKEVESAILPAKAPLLLSHLGLVTRFKLQAFVNELVSASKRADCEAILLVVASHDASNVAPIADVTVPGLLPSHRLRVPRAWVDNEQNMAAS